MVIDTSALVAIVFDEPERPLFNRLIAADSTRLISAATVLETGIVVAARIGPQGESGLDLLLRRAQVEVVAFDTYQCDTARAAFRRYGKGRHPASLNLGDCFSYALAKSSGEPLLFKGDDFAKTDLQRAPGSWS